MRKSGDRLPFVHIKATGGRGTPREIEWGGVRSLPKALSCFRPKSAIFFRLDRYPISDLHMYVHRWHKQSLRRIFVDGRLDV